MVQKPAVPRDEKSAAQIRAHVLFIEARFYEDIADLLVEGAIAECTKRGVTFERITVPGALEIPQVLAAAAEARSAGRTTFDGAVAPRLRHSRRNGALRHRLQQRQSLADGCRRPQGSSRRQRYSDRRYARSGVGARRGRNCRQRWRCSACMPAACRNEAGFLGNIGMTAKGKPRAGEITPRTAARIAAVQALYQMGYGRY